MHNEHSFIATFVKRNKRDRYREILSNPRLRHKFTERLAHFTDFDPKFRLPIPSKKLFIDNITFELKKRHSPELVFAISEDPTIDQKELPLVEALKQTVGRGIGAVLSCIPGRLAFVETEDERFILERHDPLEKREYVRFVIGRKDEDSHVEQGIFQAAAQAMEWQGYPLFGPDLDPTKGGIGLFQLDPPSNSQDYWSWSTNEADGLNLLSGKKSGAYSHWTAQITQAQADNGPNPPSLSGTYCLFQNPQNGADYYGDADWIHSYNAYYYTQWVRPAPPNAGYWNMIP